MSGFLKRLQYTDEISDSVRKIIDETPGYSVYGQKVRMPLRMPPKLAVDISAKAKANEQTVNEFIVDQLKILFADDNNSCLVKRFEAIEAQMALLADEIR